MTELSSSDKHYRAATLAESLAILKARLSEHLSPAENRDIDEAILLGNERDTWRELAQNAEERLRSNPSAAVESEGYPGIAHDLEMMRAALRDLEQASLRMAQCWNRTDERGPGVTIAEVNAARQGVDVARRNALAALKNAAPQATAEVVPPNSPENTTIKGLPAGAAPSHVAPSDMGSITLPPQKSEIQLLVEAWREAAADHRWHPFLRQGMTRCANELEERLESPRSASPPMQFSHAQAVCILKCRDALLAKDIDEAWHWLYTLDSKQVPHDPFKPWADLERLAATESTSNGKRG